MRSRRGGTSPQLSPGRSAVIRRLGPAESTESLDPTARAATPVLDSYGLSNPWARPAFTEVAPVLGFSARRSSHIRHECTRVTCSVTAPKGRSSHAGGIPRSKSWNSSGSNATARSRDQPRRCGDATRERARAAGIWPRADRQAAEAGASPGAKPSGTNAAATDWPRFLLHRRA
jgi:hypothetical protein